MIKKNIWKHPEKIKLLEKGITKGEIPEGIQRTLNRVLRGILDRFPSKLPGETEGNLNL